MNPEPQLHPNRVTVVRDRGTRAADYLLYWMQAAQRVADNHALEYAIREANRLSVPPLVLFCLTDGYPEANLRHYHFMLEGLQDVRDGLAARGIEFICAYGNPVELVPLIAQRAALLVTERAYLSAPKQWRSRIAEQVDCTVVEVETNVIVPVRTASSKREYAARTIRPKLRSLFAEYCRPVPRFEPARRAARLEVRGLERIDLDDIARVTQRLDIDSSVGVVSAYYRGGEREAARRFDAFLSRVFFTYSTFRNEPKQQAVSAMSPYLHFGQVSPLKLALGVWTVEARSGEARSGEARIGDVGNARANSGTLPGMEEAIAAAGNTTAANDGLRENKRVYIEELCVRRELAHNYTEYEPAYDRYDALPEWARATLEKHRSDPRPARYDQQTLQAAGTDDPYWNAAMKEMLKTGFMHNYMRMYWGKQIIAWTADPREAFRVISYLNNRYFLDGRDPNSYANVAWLFGLHDRPWPERPIYGTVRTMNANGLRRKCDIDGYVGWVDSL